MIPPKYLKPAFSILMAAKIATAAEGDPSHPKTSAPVLPEVVVTGREERSWGLFNSEGVALPRYSQPLVDTPQTVHVVPQQLMEDQEVTTLREALRNVSGLSIAAGEGGNQGDSLTLRGFTARNDLFLDGMRDFGSYHRDSFNLEAVEVLKGPASVMFGRGSTGGVVNQVSKKAALKAAAEGSFGLGTDRTARGTLDVNKPLSGDSALRLNVMGHENGVAGRPVTEYRRFGVAPTLAFGIGTSTRTTLSYLHQSENDIPDYGIPFLFDRPAPVNRTSYYGFEDHNFLKTDVDVITAKVERDVNSNLSLRNQLRYARYTREAQITQAQIPSTVNQATPVASINVTRNQIAASSLETSINNDTSVNLKFKTGGIRHSLTSGFEVARETSKPIRYTWSGVPNTSLTQPNTDQNFAGTQTVRTKVSASVLTLAPYLLDVIELSDQWELVGGARWDYIDSDYKQMFPTETQLGRIDRMVSWRGGVVYKPARSGSVYFNYGTSFNPSAESLSLSASNNDLDPEKTRTFELGSKWDLEGGRLSVQGAVFRSHKYNARTTDPTNASLNVLSGTQRVNGVDIGVSGRPYANWQVWTTYTYLSAKVTATNRAAELGAPLANTPKHTAALWNTVGLSQRWEAGAGFKTMSERIASTTQDATTGRFKRVDGYWSVDGMAKYQLAPDMDLQMNFYNLTNSYYIDAIHPSHIVPGAGRSALMTLNFKL